jgi:histidine phosphotransferase ChpT
MFEKERLLELMSARMFHDLAGPIGAVNNSVEFFQEENEDIRKKAFEIVENSSHEAVLRLKYFRQAYGPKNDKEASLSEVLELVKEFYEKSKVQLVCNNDSNMHISSFDAKIILNFAIIGLSAMIYGGTLEVLIDDDQLIIRFDGKDLILSEETMRLVKGELDKINLTSTNVQVYYTNMIVENSKRRVFIKAKPGYAEFTIK